MNNLTDQQLLHDYAEHRSEAAFAEIVRRHIDLVYSVAHRRMGERHAAGDVSQNVFLTLAQNAENLSNVRSLSSWLHGTARNLAAKALRTDIRRRAREHEAFAMNAQLGGESTNSWETIAPHLDDAVAKLTESDREALLLRYFERKSAREMAQALGISDEAAQKRVNRAVDRLREIFSKQGISVGAAGLAGLISLHAVQSAPLDLIAAITAVAHTVASPGTAVAITKTITMTSLQKTFATMTIMAASAFLIYQAWQISDLRARMQDLQQQNTDKISELVRGRDQSTQEASLLRKENERLNQNTSELLQLRGKLSVLQRQLDAAHAVPKEQSQPEDTPGQPADEYSAHVQANVKWDHGIALGGWRTPKGKITLYAVKPEKTSDAAQVLIKLQHWVCDEADAKRLGLESILTDNKESASFAEFEFAIPAKPWQVPGGLLPKQGFKVETPEITTTIGRQSSIKTAEGIFEVLPTISADEGSVDLVISVKLN